MLTPTVKELVRHGAPGLQNSVRLAGVALPAVAAVRAVQFYARHPQG